MTAVTGLEQAMTDSLFIVTLGGAVEWLAVRRFDLP